MVLDSIRKQAEQAIKSKPASSIKNKNKTNKQKKPNTKKEKKEKKERKKIPFNWISWRFSVEVPSFQIT